MAGCCSYLYGFLVGRLVSVEFHQFVFILAAGFLVAVGFFHAAFTALALFFFDKRPVYDLPHALVQVDAGTCCSGDIDEGQYGKKKAFH